MVMTPPEPQADPEFMARYRAIFNDWQSGNLQYSDAVKQLGNLKREASEADHLLHQGLIENILGIINGYRANYDLSVQHFEEAYRLFERCGHRERLATAALNIGETYRLRGNFTRARTYFHQAYEAAKRLGSTSSQAVALGNEGQMWLSLGSVEKARACVVEAIKLCQLPWSDPETADDAKRRLSSECDMHYALALIALEQDLSDECWQEAMRSYELAEAVNEPIKVGLANRVMADVITHVGHAVDLRFSDDPDVYYKAALKAFRDVKAEGEVAKTLYAQGQSLIKRHKKQSAARLFQQALVIFTRLGMSDDAAKAAEAQVNAI